MVLVQIDLIQADVSQLQSQAVSLWADVVIMNPPFGTRRKGADLEFLRAAFQVSHWCRASSALSHCMRKALIPTTACSHRYAP